MLLVEIHAHKTTMKTNAIPRKQLVHSTKASVQWKRLVMPAMAILVAWSAHAATQVNTFVYHQLTSFQSSPGPMCSAISANGSKIAWACPYWGGPSRSNLIYTVNFDGSGLCLADMYAVGDCYPKVAISADGTKVMSANSGVIRVVGSDGSNPHTVIQINGGYPDYRFSQDGTRIFFSVDRYFSTTPDTGTREPGIYVINADGTGLREVAGVTSFALFFGFSEAQMMPDGYLYNWNGGSPFDVSGDGTKVACYVWTPDQYYRIIGFSTNGTSMHELPLTGTPVNGINRVGLDWNAGKLFYDLAYSPCCSSGEELGIMNWDGTGRRVLLSNYSTNQSSGGYGFDTININYDGSKIEFGSTSWLINTDGTGRLQLFGPGIYNEVARWGTYFCRMSTNATRFTYLSPIPNGGNLQICTLEMNPSSLGLAPYITNASAAPSYVTTNSSVSTFLTASAPTNGLLGSVVSAMAYRNGLEDASVQNQYLQDNGSSGDVTAHNGVYSGWMTANSWSVVGPRTLRYKCEWLGTDSKYHATVVEMSPFFVNSAAPTNPPPTITTISPANASPGTVVTIVGSGFDPIATNNVILFGNIQAQVISVNPGGTQLVVVVPPNVPVGTVPVIVGSLGQSSTPTNYSIPDPDASTLTVKMLAGLDIMGTVGMTYRIDYQSDLTDTNSWVPLATNTLTCSPYFWVDISSTNQPKRFYRSVHVTP
jgi:hypothetical protein